MYNNNNNASEVLRFGSIILFYLSKLWKVKFSIPCDVILWWGCRGNLTLITLESKRIIYHLLDSRLLKSVQGFPSAFFHCNEPEIQTMINTAVGLLLYLSSSPINPNILLMPLMNQTQPGSYWIWYYTRKVCPLYAGIPQSYAGDTLWLLVQKIFSAVGGAAKPIGCCVHNSRKYLNSPTEGVLLKTIPTPNPTPEVQFPEGISGGTDLWTLCAPQNFPFPLRDMGDSWNLIPLLVPVHYSR